MSDFVKVASLADLKPGQARTVDLNGNAVALYNVEGTVYATANTCAHRGGPLGEGMVSGTSVSCPWHGWEYDVTSGQCAMDPSIAVQKYDVKVEGDDILVAV